MAPSQRRQELITNQKADPYKVCLFLKKGAFPLIRLLIRTFVKNYKSTADRAVRTAYGNLACIVSVVCNLLLAGGKIAVGVLTGSVAITADGMNNLSDASSNIVSSSASSSARARRTRSIPMAMPGMSIWPVWRSLS